MTMLDDTAEGGAEAAVKLVKLGAEDWRKLALVLIALFCAGSLAGYRLIAYIARSEVQRLDTVDIAAAAHFETIDGRLKRIEDAQSDIAVLKTDVGWIRAEIERISRDTTKRKD